MPCFLYVICVFYSVLLLAYRHFSLSLAIIRNNATVYEFPYSRFVHFDSQALIIAIGVT